MLRDAIDESKWSDFKFHYSENRERKYSINPTINQVSALFTLNEKQHVAFSIAGSALLDSFLRAIQKDSQGVPLRMYIGGVGGTGKSRIVEALRYLSRTWGQPNAVQIVASTGIAAVLIKGETVHRKLFLNTSHSFKPTLAQCEAFRHVYMLIRDEISMASAFRESLHKYRKAATHWGSSQREAQNTYFNHWRHPSAASGTSFLFV